MGKEIERKFLVKGEDWRALGKGVSYCQGYLSKDKERVVRVRIAGAKGYITLKGAGVGLVRPEYEYPIPVADAKEILDTLVIQPLIEKIRYTVVHEGLCWEIDEFLAANAGLIVAEVELKHPEQSFTLPPWVGEEISTDYRYANTYLTEHPFTQW